MDHIIDDGAISEVLTVVEDILSHGYDSSETTASRDIADIVQSAMQDVDTFCNRYFITALESTHTYSAPLSPYLSIREIVKTSEEIQVSVGEVELIGGSDYQLILNEEGTAYESIKRLNDDGKAVWWSATLDELQPDDAISVTADHGYATSVPSAIKRAYIISAAQGAYDRGLLYTGSGESDLGTLASGPPSLWQSKARPYIRRKALQAVANWE